MENIKIENSIIRDQTKLINLPPSITDSVLGKNVEVRFARMNPEELNGIRKLKIKYVIGDDTKCTSL